jgi:hypothetical protein
MVTCRHYVATELDFDLAKGTAQAIRRRGAGAAGSQTCLPAPDIREYKLAVATWRNWTLGVPAIRQTIPLDANEQPPWPNPPPERAWKRQRIHLHRQLAAINYCREAVSASGEGASFEDDTA